VSLFLTRDALGRLPADGELRQRLERGLRKVLSFQSLEIHPPAFGSEPFFDGRSLSFPLRRADEDIALVVLEGVERPPEPGALLAVCAELIADEPEAQPVAAREPERPQVLEVLPLGKVVLGVAEGTKAGQRLLILGHSGAEPLQKAEAEVLSVQGGRAMAQIVSRSDPFAQVRAGDLVAPAESREEAPEQEPAGSGLEAFRVALEREGAGWEKFAVLVARLEGGEVVRTRFGSQRLETLLEDMSAALLAFGGAGSVVGKDGSELLLAAFPNKTATEALAVHGPLASLAAGLTGSVIAGCADYPAWGFGRAEVIDNAWKALEHARLLGPDKTAAFNAVSLNVSADALYARGDLLGAAREYLRALDIDPEDTNVLNSLGVCYANLGQLEEAALQFRKAIAVRPNEVMAHYNLGFVHLKRGEREEALERFQAAAAVDPASFEAHFQLGRLLLEAGKAAEAKGHLLAAEAIERRPYIHRHLGDCLLLLGQSAEAAGHYKRAVRANPEDAHCLSQLAAIYLELGSDLEVAAALLKKSLELEPDCRLHRERLEAALARLPRGLAD
jgi:tetratricopeptide (TPR) repeat protein